MDDVQRMKDKLQIALGGNVYVIQQMTALQNLKSTQGQKARNYLPEEDTQFQISLWKVVPHHISGKYKSKH